MRRRGRRRTDGSRLSDVSLRRWRLTAQEARVHQPCLAWRRAPCRRTTPGRTSCRPTLLLVDRNAAGNSCFLERREDSAVVEVIDARAVAEHRVVRVVVRKHAARGCVLVLAAGDADAEREVERLSRLSVRRARALRLLARQLNADLGEGLLQGGAAAQVEEQPLAGLRRLLQPLQRRR